MPRKQKIRFDLNNSSFLPSKTFQATQSDDHLVLLPILFTKISKILALILTVYIIFISFQTMEDLELWRGIICCNLSMLYNNNYTLAYL